MEGGVLVRVGGVVQMVVGPGWAGAGFRQGAWEKKGKKQTSEVCLIAASWRHSLQKRRSEGFVAADGTATLMRETQNIR
jgi:hypothetical protein